MRADPYALALAALALALVATTIGGVLARRVAQPPVIGEMLAGILLGPCALGALPGNPLGHLFTKDVQVLIAGLGQIGLVGYLFGVGLRLDLRSARRELHASALVSVVSLVVPLAVGAGTGWVLSQWGSWWSGDHPIPALAIVFAVTAVPVLARIIDDAGLVGRPAAVVSISAAGLVDTVTWGLLAGLLAVYGAEGGSLVPHVIGLAAIIVVAIVVVRPALRWAMDQSRITGTVTGSPGPLAIAVVLGCVLGMSAATAAVGLHAVFGALVCGLLAPRNDATATSESSLTSVLLPEAEPVSTGEAPIPAVAAPIVSFGTLLLPTFFVATGLSMRPPSGSLLALAGIVAVVGLIATASKIVPSALAARAAGLDRRESWTVGVLMNTRGLTELVVLSVLIQGGLLGETDYLVLVVVSLLATMATPWLLIPLRRHRDPAPPEGSAEPAAVAVEPAAVPS